MSNMLTQEHINKLRAHLTEAIEKHLVNGGTLIKGRFDDFHGGCCPVQCLVGQDMKALKAEGTIHGFQDAVAKKLDIPFAVGDMWRLVDGFDNSVVTEEDKDSTCYKLGQELRAKYLPEENP